MTEKERKELERLRRKAELEWKFDHGEMPFGPEWDEYEGSLTEAENDELRRLSSLEVDERNAETAGRTHAMRPEEKLKLCVHFKGPLFDMDAQGRIRSSMQDSRDRQRSHALTIDCLLWEAELLACEKTPHIANECDFLYSVCWWMDGHTPLARLDVSEDDALRYFDASPVSGWAKAVVRKGYLPPEERGKESTEATTV